MEFLSINFFSINLLAWFGAYILGIFTCCFVDNSAGYFECKNCKKKFIPTMKAYILAPHTITTRKLKCPHCGKITYCKKRLSK